MNSFDVEPGQVVRFLADHDPLTRLRNRRSFVRQLELGVVGEQLQHRRPVAALDGLARQQAVAGLVLRPEVAIAEAWQIAEPPDRPEKSSDDIERTIAGLYPTPKLLILNYPHNPTSITIEPWFS